MSRTPSPSSRAAAAVRDRRLGQPPRLAVMVRPTLPLTPRRGADWPRARGAALAGTASRRRRARGAPASGGRGRGGWWLAVAVIAGLMAMHGFGTHGSHSAMISSEAHPAASSMLGHSPAPSLSSAQITTRHVAATTVSSDGGDLLEAAASALRSDSGSSSLLSLCLALLVLGVHLLRSRTGSRVAWTVPRMTTALRCEALPATAHSLDAPSRAELCIWRC